LLFSLSAGDLPRFPRPEAPATQVELASGWHLSSARDVKANGSV